MSGLPDPVVKHRADAPHGFFAVESAGLHWLAQARSRGGASVALPVQPVSPGDTRIAIARVTTHPATPAAAERFGRELAATHRAGAPWFGCPPQGWDGDGFIGPIPLPHNTVDRNIGWGRFFARYRLEPFLRQAVDHRTLPEQGRRAVSVLCERLADEDPDLCGPAEPVARLHGDLWSGNVLWDGASAVLIDPSAHGGHRESDLAMLALFGLPHLDRVLAAYHEAWPLAEGWRERVGLHQLFPLLVHTVLFGSSYGAQAAAAAAHYV
ncbi:MAG: fructosamine kinase family protein [Kineosporiaceae bacterium]|nr:fructosamine kinase family protein [Kineosporiaceae bacterium]